MKQCNRWDDDGTHYAIEFGELKEQPFRLIQHVSMTQSDIINFGGIPQRIKRILPIAARSLEIWENTRGRETRHWRVHPTFEIKPGLMQAVVTLIYCCHSKRDREERLKLTLAYDYPRLQRRTLSKISNIT